MPLRNLSWMSQMLDWDSVRFWIAGWELRMGVVVERTIRWGFLDVVRMIL